MGSEDRSAADALIARLQADPFQFHFFQAVRRLDCAYPHLPPIGHSRRPSEDPVRFCQEPSLVFAPSTLSEFRPADGQRPAQLFVRFLGLLGPNGPLPLALTEYVRDREYNHRDATLARFLDIFNHRMISLFYRAWACNQQTVNFERGDEDRFAVYVGSLFGIGMASFRRRDAVPDVAKLHYAGRLVCQTRHAEGLRAVVQDYFGLRTAINEFIGRWMDVPPECRCRLGQSPDTGLLGRTVVVGARVWDCQQKFRIRLGPMTLVQYERLLPGGDSLRRLVAWVRLYTCDQWEWDVNLILKAEEVPEARLGRQGKLGWTTWLWSRPFQRDADDLKLRPYAA